MIKVQKFTNTDGDKSSYLIKAFSDTKAEVSSASLSDYIGLPEDAEKIEMGSRIMTASAEVAYMKSDGAWNWV